MKIEIKFDLFRTKSDMILGQLYEQFVKHRRILTAQKGEVHPKYEAQNYLLRLDERYAEMIANIDNGSITGKAYPAPWQKPMGDLNAKERDHNVNDTRSERGQLQGENRRRRPRKS